MRRRDFIAFLGGAAVTWPRLLVAQSPSKVYRIGLLTSGPTVTDNSPFGAALIRGLAQRGYALDRNLTLERRGAHGPAAAPAWRAGDKQSRCHRHSRLSHRARRQARDNTSSSGVRSRRSGPHGTG